MGERTSKEKNQNKEERRIRSRERRIAKARRFNLFSNEFMAVALNDIPACQYVLRIITGMEDLVVKEVRMQYRVSKIASHDAVLDILAEDAEGKLYNIEIQRAGTIDHARRTRFYGSMIDSEFLQKGKDYEEMPEVRVIYISEKDIWKKGKAVYVVRKTFEDTDVIYEDGIHTTYINAAVNDGSEIAALMDYFKRADPHDMSHGALSERIHFLKCEEGGREVMCEITEGFVEEGRREGLKAGRREGLKAGRKEGKRVGRREGIEMGIKQFILDNQEENVPRERILAKLCRRFELSEEKSKLYYERFAE